MATGRKPGRPRKNPASNNPPLTAPIQNDTQSKNDTPLLFDNETIERIKSCDEVYLVTKNAERLPDKTRDKQVHDASWLKDIL